MQVNVLIYFALTAIVGISSVIYGFSWNVILLVPLFFYWLYKKNNRRLLIACTVFYIFNAGYYFVYDEMNKTKLYGSEIYLKGTIDSIPTLNGNRFSFIFKLHEQNEKITVTYYLKSKNEMDVLQLLKVGHQCSIQGDLSKPKAPSNKGAFNYQKYLYQQKIHWQYSAKNLSKTNCGGINNTFLYKLKQSRANGIELVKELFPEESEAIALALLFGDRTEMTDVQTKTYQSQGLIHLLAISGLHVALLTAIVFYLLIRIGFTREHAYILLIMVFPVYIILTGASPSVIRAVCMIIIYLILKLFAKKLSPIDVLSFVFIGMLLINPYYLLHAGFQLSFIVTFSILLSASIINQTSSKIGQLLLVSFISQLSSLPIILFHFYEIPLLSVIFNLLFVPFFSVIILPMTIFCFVLAPIFPFVSEVFISLENTLLIIAEQFIQPFNDIRILQLRLGQPNQIMIIVYIVVILVAFINLERKRYTKSAFILVAVLSIHHFIPYLSPVGEFTMLDVGQGDTFIIELPNRKGVYVIDTGKGEDLFKKDWEKSKSSFNVSEDIIAPYLKCKGIKKIDKLIITHGDNDHIGSANELFNDFKIKEILLAKGTLTTLEKKLIQTAKASHTSVKMVQSGYTWKQAGFTFFVLNPLETLLEEENNQSLVLLTKLGGKSFLLTGDLEESGEKMLISKYPNLKIDVLKIGHHGSNSSTSNDFLEQLKPKIALISVSENNRYGHPHDDVIQRLNHHDVTILRTDEHGGVYFKFNKKNGTFYPTFP